MNRRTVLGALATVGVGTSIIGTASAKQNRGNREDRVVEVIKDDEAWFLLYADECLGPVGSESQREYLEGTLKARLTLQHDGDLQGEEAVRVLGSIRGEVEPRYGEGVWRVKVHFNSQYGYFLGHRSPREIYVTDAEVVARPIRGNEGPTLRAPAQVEIVNDRVGVSTGSAQC